MYKAVTLWGQGGHGDSTLWESFTKTFLPVPVPINFHSPPGSLAQGWLESEGLHLPPPFTCQAKTTEQDRSGSELKLPGRKTRCKICGLMDEGLRETLYPTPHYLPLLSGQGQWEGSWEVTRSMKQEVSTMPAPTHGCSWVSGTLPASPGHIPVTDPQEESKQGLRALWMDSAHVPWPQELRLKNILSCNIHKAQERPPSPKVHQTPTRPCPLCPPQIAFLLAPLHCVNTEVFFGKGTRLAVVGKTQSRSLLAPRPGGRVPGVRCRVAAF